MKVQEYWRKKIRAASPNNTWEEIYLLGVKICTELAMSCVVMERAKRPRTEGNQRSWRDIKLDPSQELRFPFRPKKDLDCCLQLTNMVEEFIAFNIETNKKKYHTQPIKGIMPPFSKFYIVVTLRAQEKAPPNMQCLDTFIVQSSRVSEDFTSLEITRDFLKKAKEVTEVILPITYVALEEYEMTE